MPSFLQRLLQLLRGASAAIAAQAFGFVYARFRARGLGQAEEMETWLLWPDLEDYGPQRSRATFEQLTLLFARAMALHFAARAVDDQKAHSIWGAPFPLPP
ncbi:hypothetical protein BC826DRAFT_1114131 [Russula brevipes]|nr:hypothetical protein BC826DRAFT_1114131 [Russula brevipes]